MAKEIETVFDHGVTKHELEDVVGCDSFTRTELSSLFTQEQNYGMIYRLYMYRGDEKTAKMYADKIPNTSGKIFGICYRDFMH